MSALTAMTLTGACAVGASASPVSPARPARPVTAAALAGGMPVTAAAASAPASGGGWRWPRELSAPRDSAGGAEFTALSCASRSDCTAVGTYQDRSGRYRFFAITERRDVWGKGLGIAAPVASKKLNVGGSPVLSCASAGNCAADDSYSTRSQQGAFVVSETNGTWGKAQKMRSSPSAISCPAPGDCTAALAPGYLVNERRGTWRKAFPVPGLAALHGGQFISLGLISCPSPGNCTAAGNYYSAGDHSFVVTERHGIWGNAQPVTTTPGAEFVLEALSCASAGNCVAGGAIYPPTGWPGAFAVTQTHGTWGTAESLPGAVKPGAAGIYGLDCPAAGACSAFGTLAVHRQMEPFVSTEKNGTWHNPQIITGPGPGTGLDQLSCSAAGSCVLVAAIEVRSSLQAAAAAQVNGRWGPDRVLRGILAVDHGTDSQIDAVSCPARSRCTAIGSFGTHLFVTTQR